MSTWLICEKRCLESDIGFIIGRFGIEFHHSVAFCGLIQRTGGIRKIGLAAEMRLYTFDDVSQAL